eukprot:gene177-186_t
MFSTRTVVNRLVRSSIAKGRSMNTLQLQPVSFAPQLSGPAVRNWIVTQVSPLRQVVDSVLENIFGGIMLIKRTFQPSIIKKKRSQGYLARKATRTGLRILNRRRQKRRTRLV